jgi:hypothetical protein
MLLRKEKVLDLIQRCLGEVLEESEPETLTDRRIDTVEHRVRTRAFDPVRSAIWVIEAMIDGHAADLQLYELLLMEVPHRAEGTQDFAVRLHGAFLLAISSRARELKTDRNLDKQHAVREHDVFGYRTRRSPASANGVPFMDLRVTRWRPNLGGSMPTSRY